VVLANAQFFLLGLLYGPEKKFKTPVVGAQKPNSMSVGNQSQATGYK
jgi:hypothetical protein